MTAIVLLLGVVVVIIAGAMISGLVVRAGLHRGRTPMSRALEIVEAFVAGWGAPHEWDDFLALPQHDPQVELLRLKCSEVWQGTWFRDPQSLVRLQELASQVRGGARLELIEERIFVVSRDGAQRDLDA